ncbi:hypothetical protein Acor_17350 [Acrocarpospora corrugata]|uniref:Uncharacterized protein n=1 Tax=Acrocarpospora corrugata TaxID=35763 RepID=A0A5M3VVH0_9ACTN|nr:hypothetical protein Acor_17350 [Acrocarpospora corrugata]
MFGEEIALQIPGRAWAVRVSRPPAECDIGDLAAWFVSLDRLFGAHFAEPGEEFV